jgi:hypothetical protein
MFVATTRLDAAARITTIVADAHRMLHIYGTNVVAGAIDQDDWNIRRGLARIKPECERRRPAAIGPQGFVRRCPSIARKPIV